KSILEERRIVARESQHGFFARGFRSKSCPAVQVTNRACALDDAGILPQPCVSTIGSFQTSSRLLFLKGRCAAVPARRLARRRLVCEREDHAESTSTPFVFGRDKSSRGNDRARQRFAFAAIWRASTL